MLAVTTAEISGALHLSAEMAPQTGSCKPVAALGL